MNISMNLTYMELHWHGCEHSGLVWQLAASWFQSNSLQEASHGLSCLRLSRKVPAHLAQPFQAWHGSPHVPWNHHKPSTEKALKNGSWSIQSREMDWNGHYIREDDDETLDLVPEKRWETRMIESLKVSTCTDADLLMESYSGQTIDTPWAHHTAVKILMMVRGTFPEWPNISAGWIVRIQPDPWVKSHQW